jgi:hypothetical protein
MDIEEWTDNIIRCNIDELKDMTFPLDERVGLKVMSKNVEYNLILNLKSTSDKLLVFGSAAIPLSKREKYLNKPVFGRIKWQFDQSTIHYDDPTRLIDGVDLLGGWGIGTEDNWYLKEIANIIKIIADNVYDYPSIEDSYKNLIFYGSSIGGFMSIQLSILLKNSTSIAEIPQLNVMKWGYWSTLKKELFPDLTNEEINSKYSHRINVYDLMMKCKYIPNTYLILDCSDERDFRTQFKDFFLKLNDLPFSESNNLNKIHIRIDGKNKGHAILSYGESHELIDNVCSLLDNSKFR